MGGRTHGMQSIAARGVAAVEELGKVERLSELRLLLATEPGRTEVRVELAARLAIICEAGFEYLRKQAEAGDNTAIADGTGPIKYLSVYANSLERMLRTWPEEGETRKTVGEVLDEMDVALKEAEGDD